MATSVSQAATRHRPTPVLATVGVLIFLGLSALAGGVALTFGSAPPDEWLDQVPGLVLGIGFGLGSLVTAYGVLRKPAWGWLDFARRLTGHHWSWVATVLIGVGHVAWIALELIYLPEPLQLVYGAVGVALVLLPTLPPVRTYLRDEPVPRS